MSTIVSEFTTQLTASNSLPGVIAIGFLIGLLLELEIIRAFRGKRVKPSFIVLQTAIIPLVLVFAVWMVARFIDLIY